MKIGFQSSAYNGLSLFEELKFARDNHVDFFDIFFDGYLPHDISEEEYHLITEFKNDGFDFTVHLPINIDKCSESELKELSDFVQRVGPVTSTVHFNKLKWDLLEKLILLFGKNTKLCIENTIPDLNPFYNSDYLSFMNEVCKKFDVYSTFDTGHCNVNITAKNQKDCGKIALYAKALLDSGVKILTVHNHDNLGDKDSHGFVGSGVINFDDFYSVLKNANQNPMLVIEHWNDNQKSLKNIHNLLT